MKTRWRVLLLALTLLLSVGVRAQQSPNFELSVGSDVLTATGVTPGQEVIFFGIGQTSDGFDSTVKHYVTTAKDDTRSRTAIAKIAGGIPTKSVWVAVDAQTTRFALSTPSTFEVHPWPIGVTFRKGAGGAPSMASFFAGLVDVLYVHPDGTAAVMRGGDGNIFDSDLQRDGYATISLAKSEPVADRHGRPSLFAAGGILFVIDPVDLRVSAVRVTGGALGGGQP